MKTTQSQTQKREYTSDPTFNAIQELIYQYKKCQQYKAELSPIPVDIEYFIQWLIKEGWSYDYQN